MALQQGNLKSGPSIVCFGGCAGKAEKNGHQEAQEKGVLQRRLGVQCRSCGKDAAAQAVGKDLLLCWPSTLLRSFVPLWKLTVCGRYES